MVVFPLLYVCCQEREGAPYSLQCVNIQREGHQTYHKHHNFQGTITPSFSKTQ